MSKASADEGFLKTNGAARPLSMGSDKDLDPDPAIDDPQLLTPGFKQKKCKEEKLAEEWANPSVIGLLGFALTTMCIGLATAGNLGIDDNPGLGMALIYGGGAQFIAGLVALRKGLIFPGTVFVSYGSFWMSAFLMLTVLPVYFKIPPKENDLLIYWFMWTMVTTAFLISSWKHGPGVFATFITLDLAFLMLDIKQLMAIHDINNPTFNKATGWITFLCGLTAFSTATAILTNSQYGRTIIPLEKYR